MTQSVIGNLRVNMGLDTAAFTAGAMRAEKTLSGLQRSLTTFGAGVAGVLGGLGLNAIGSSIVTAMRQVAEIGDLAETIGITAEQVQAFNRMALASGASTEAMARGLQEIAEQSADASSKLSQLFAANGLSAQGRETNDVIRDFMNLLQNARTPTEQLAMATSVLGTRVGRELVEALRTGAEGYDNATRAMVESGNYHTNAEVDRLQEIETKYNEVIANISTAWQGMVVGIASGIDKIQQDFSSGGPSGASELWNWLTGKPVRDWDIRTGEPIGWNESAGGKGNLPPMQGPPTIFPRANGSKPVTSNGLGQSRSNRLAEIIPVTAYDIRGASLEMQNFTAQLKEADVMAKSLAGDLSDGISFALTDMAFNAKSAGEAMEMLKQSALDMLRSITDQLLKSGLNMLLGNLGTSFGGAQGFGGFGGFYANGGTLGAGKWGIAGEAGPEIIHGPARITPMEHRRGGITVNNNVVNNGSSQVSTRATEGSDGSINIETLIEDKVIETLGSGRAARVMGARYGARVASRKV